MLHPQSVLFFEVVIREESCSTPNKNSLTSSCGNIPEGRKVDAQHRAMACSKDVSTAPHKKHLICTDQPCLMFIQLLFLTILLLNANSI